PATATPAPGNGADNNTPAPQPSQDTPSTPAPPSATPAPQPSQDTPSTPAPSSPAADQGGAGANSGPVGSTGVTTRGQISNGNGPAPVSARGGIRNTNTPAESAAPTGPTLANTGSAATLAAGVGAIALAGGVTLVVARRRH
ncbi:MAG: LPXTG cell wall anchor domain-containing protein, partial [Pauljensenia sp.]